MPLDFAPEVFIPAAALGELFRRRTLLGSANHLPVGFQKGGFQKVVSRASQAALQRDGHKLSKWTPAAPGGLSQTRAVSAIEMTNAVIAASREGPRTFLP